MNAFQKCPNTADAVPLYLPQQLYLKPIARINISVQLPQFKKLVGKSISNLEIMEKLRSMIKPEEYSLLRVTKSTAEVIRFEAEFEDRTKIEKCVSKLNQKTIKMKDFKEPFKVRAAEWKSDFPTRHVWDSYFRDAKNMDDMKPGERPDTVYISGLPIKWFIPHHLLDEDEKPSEKIFYRIFEKFGSIRYVDIPICDPYRNKMKAHIAGVKEHSFDDKIYFEGYVQFKDYIGFTKTMDALRGMKLVRKDEDEVLAVNIKVDFDKSKHLSDASIKRREIVRDRLVEKQRAKEEKEKNEKEVELQKEEEERKKQIKLKNQKEIRRRLREEKRKAKVLEKLKIKGADEINEKIAKEEKKLLKAQRKLEAIRLVEALFKRIKDKLETSMPSTSRSKYVSTLELMELKNTSESDVKLQRKKLHEAIEGRVMLKSMLSRGRTYSSSSSDSGAANANTKSKRTASAKQSENEIDLNHAVNMYGMSDPNWFGYMGPENFYPYPMDASFPLRGHPSYMPYFPRNRGFSRGGPGPSRGPFPRRGRGFRYRGNYRGKGLNNYPPELQEEYYKYFSKFLSHDDRDHRSYSRSRSRSRSYSRKRSRSRSYSRSRSHRRSYSRSRSRDRSYRSRSRSRRHSKSRRDSKSVSKRSHHSSGKGRSRSRSRQRSKSAKKDKSRSPSYKSIDSSKFISPSRLRNTRSKSWSFPRNTDKDKRSWSKSPEKK